jgi:hypothetical protein
MKSNCIVHSVAVMAATIFSALGTSEARAASLSMALDSSQSAITLSGSFNSIPLGDQGPGSRTSNFSGSILVDVDNLLAPTSIQILGSSAAASITGQWLPQAGGGPAAGNPGTAQDANYGLQLSGGALGNAYAAIRNLQFNVTSGSQAVAGGAFPSTQTLNVSSGLFAFNLPPAFMEPPGEDDLSGDVLMNASATSSTYTVTGSTATLTIPIDIVDEDDLTIAYSGRLVATAVIPEPTSALLILAGLVSVLLGSVNVRRRA